MCVCPAGENILKGVIGPRTKRGVGADPRATGGLVSNLPLPRVNKTKQHTHSIRLFGNKRLPSVAYDKL